MSIRRIIKHKNFEIISGTLFFLNPVVILLQLIKITKESNVEAISIPMWFLFVLLQITSSLVAIKSKNYGMFFAFLFSIIFSISIIVITLLKS
jgi:hypothetical protein